MMSLKNKKRESDIMVLGASAITLLIITLFNPLVTPESPAPQILLIFVLVVIFLWAMAIITHISYETSKTRHLIGNDPDEIGGT